MTERPNTMYFGLKVAFAVLPFSFFLWAWPRHAALDLSAGLGLGVLLSQIIPPRLSVGRTVLWAAAAVLFGALISRLRVPF